MPVCSSAILGSVSGLSLFSNLCTSDAFHSLSPFPSLVKHPGFSKHCLKFPTRRIPFHIVKVSVSGNANIEFSEQAEGTQVPDDTSAAAEAARQARISEDWKTARYHNDSGLIYEGRIEGYNGGGLLVRFYSLVIQADEENKKLILSEKEAVWSKYSEQVNVGDIFDGRVGSVEDYGAFVHLRFPDGFYHITGLVHVSEVSWDLVQDVRDILTEGDQVRVKVISVDREKSRITLSIKQLEEDPLLETLDKVIPQDPSAVPDSLNDSNSTPIEPLPGLESIFEELLQEDGIDDVRISRQGFEKRVVSQDLQLWLSNAPPSDQRFTLLARAGRQVQEIHLKTSLDQEGVKKALQRALERVP